eukprot:2533589-Rhodomonas_salina.2
MSDTDMVYQLRMSGTDAEQYRNAIMIGASERLLTLRRCDTGTFDSEAHTCTQGRTASSHVMGYAAVYSHTRVCACTSPHVTRTEAGGRFGTARLRRGAAVLTRAHAQSLRA